MNDQHKYMNKEGASETTFCDHDSLMFSIFVGFNVIQRFLLNMDWYGQWTAIFNIDMYYDCVDSIFF